MYKKRNLFSQGFEEWKCEDQHIVMVFLLSSLKKTPCPQMAGGRKECKRERERKREKKKKEKEGRERKKGSQGGKKGRAQTLFHELNVFH